MEREYMLTNESLGADEPLSLPHFDEEATLLSARRVVPLHEVKAERRSKRRLGFGLAIVAALVVGAAGASVIYKPREQPQQGVSGETSTGPAPAPSEAVPSNDLSLASGAASGSAIKFNERPADSVVPAPATARRNEAAKVRTPVTTRTQTARRAESDVTPDTDPSDTQDRDYQRRSDDMDLRREERREERRLRRERLSRPERSGDGLLRIREIFEGRPRP